MPYIHVLMPSCTPPNSGEKVKIALGMLVAYHYLLYIYTVLSYVQLILSIEYHLLIVTNVCYFK